MKTVTFDDEAYEILRGLKQSSKESFSDVVKRHLGKRRSIQDSAGAWSGLPRERFAEIRRESIEAFGVTKDEP